MTVSPLCKRLPKAEQLQKKAMKGKFGRGRMWTLKMITADM